VAGHLRGSGLDIREGVEIDELVRTNSGEIAITSDGGTEHFDELLVAAGREPAIPEGLLELGVETGKSGHIKTDPCGKTSVDGVFAIGDISEGPQFTHRASYQAHHLKGLLVGGDKCSGGHPTIPWAIFTTPEIGHVGLTEAESREQHGDVRVARLDARRPGSRK
jgi:pyruvate/2-oxoglutarate dehydrogenase complex dihydrolipoamide dehydrogenase (E3) component